MAEPDLQVLAEQVPSIPNNVIIWSVALGVGVFLVIALLRILFGIPLSRLLILFYVIVFGLADPENIVRVLQGEKIGTTVR